MIYHYNSEKSTFLTWLFKGYCLNSSWYLHGKWSWHILLCFYFNKTKNLWICHKYFTNLPICMYVCFWMSAYLLLCVSAYTNMYICVCMYLCIFMFMNQCVHMYVCMYMYYLCMYICIDLYTCLCVSVYLPYAYLSIYLINKKKWRIMNHEGAHHLHICS